MTGAVDTIATAGISTATSLLSGGLGTIVEVILGFALLLLIVGFVYRAMHHGK